MSNPWIEEIDRFAESSTRLEDPVAQHPGGGIRPLYPTGRLLAGGRLERIVAGGQADRAAFPAPHGVVDGSVRGGSSGSARHPPAVPPNSSFSPRRLPIRRLAAPQPLHMGPRDHRPPVRYFPLRSAEPPAHAARRATRGGGTK